MYVPAMGGYGIKLVNRRTVEQCELFILKYSRHPAIPINSNYVILIPEMKSTCPPRPFALFTFGLRKRFYK